MKYEINQHVVLFADEYLQIPQNKKKEVLVCKGSVQTFEISVFLFVHQVSINN